MNDYLFKLGSEFKDIRSLLDWTQEESAEKIGVSRNTIVNIEKNPANMKKNIAYSFYMEIYKDVYERETLSKNISKKNLQTADKDKIKDILIKAGLTGSIISMPALIPVAILSLGSMSSTSVLLNLFNSKKSDHELNKIEPEKIITLINKSIEKIKEEISKKLDIENLYNVMEFINNVNQ